MSMLITRLGAALAVSSLSMAAQAVSVAPPPSLGDWTCTGACGSSGALGDIGLSPLGNARYGYVTTAGADGFKFSPVPQQPNNEGSETNGSRFVSGAFTAAAGDQLDMRFNYISTDGKGFDDYAWARVVDANTDEHVSWLFTARSTNSGTRNIVPGDVIDKKVFDVRTVIVDYDTYNFTSKTTDDPVNWALLGASNGTCWRDNAAGCGYTGWLHSQISFAAGGSFRVEVGVMNWGDQAFDSGLAFDYAGLTAAVPEPSTFAFTLAGVGLLGLRRRQARR